MKKRGVDYKTYGRSTVLSKQMHNDFDKVFCEGNSIGSSPFGTSDSLTGKSMDLSESHVPYNLRRPFCNSLRDVSNESSTSQDSVTTPFLKAPKHTSQRDRCRGKMKKSVVRCTATADLSGKENSINPSIPDYDAIAEDSFHIETENSKAGVTKCSTPLANSPRSPQDAVPSLTPIVQVPQSATYLDTLEINHSPSIHTFSPVERLRCDPLSANYVTMRRSSRLKTKLLTSRKLLIDEDHKIFSLSPQKDFSYYDTSNTSAPMINSTMSSHHDSMDESADDLLKSIGENISNFAAINLSLNSGIPKKTTTSPLESHNSLPYNASEGSHCDSLFDVSEDLFQSHEKSDLEGLSCIAEEDTASDLNSLHSTTGAHFNVSKNFLSQLSSHSICEHEPKTAKEKLLEICEQEEYVSFSACMPPRIMNKCVKIGEGVYGEVFRSVSRDQNVAIKIIPMEGKFDVNDCPQKTFEELLPEAVIAKELSDLACGFCTVNRISCVQGSFPSTLLKQWDAYNERKPSENDRPDFFPKEQLFAVFEFADGGTALENFVMSNHRETLSVLRQVVFALAMAESSLEFEHRDLHIGNILVRPCQETKVKFTLNEDEIEFESEGVLATIIDFTISRLKKDGCAVFCDISTDDGLFEGSGDFQFDVYRDMRKTNENDWSKFYPYTNILWIQYLCKKLLTVIKVKENGREHRDSLRRLRQLNEKILNYESCYHLAMDSGLWDL